MEKSHIQEGMIVYMRYLRFMDDGTMDSRMRGRPYLVYRIDKEEEIAYLFLIRSNTGGRPEEFFYPLERRKKKIMTKGHIKAKKIITTSYVSLTDVYEMKLDDIVEKVKEIENDELIKKHGSLIFPQNAMSEISERIKLISTIDEYKEKLKKVS